MGLTRFYYNVFIDLRSETSLHFWLRKQQSFLYLLYLYLCSQQIQFYKNFLTVYQKMSKSMHESFQCAAKAIRDSDKEPNLHKVTKEEKMRLYALYKQATEGDCTTCEPKNVESDQKEKCEAWCKMKGRSKDDAEKEYVELSRTLLNKYGASKLIDF